MALFKVVVEVYVASRELDQASLSRLAFWTDELGEKEVAAISSDDIDGYFDSPSAAGSPPASAPPCAPANRSLAAPSTGT